MITYETKDKFIELHQNRSNKYTIVILPEMVSYFEKNILNNLYKKLSEIAPNSEIKQFSNQYEIHNIDAFSLPSILEAIKCKYIFNVKRNNFYKEHIKHIIEDLTDPNIFKDDITEEKIRYEWQYEKYIDWFLKTNHSTLSKEERIKIIENEEKNLKYVTNYSSLDILTELLNKEYDIEYETKMTNELIETIENKLKNEQENIVEYKKIKRTI
jgi:hypothetical protein